MAWDAIKGGWHGNKRPHRRGSNLQCVASGCFVWLPLLQIVNPFEMFYKRLATTNSSEVLPHPPSDQSSHVLHESRDIPGDSPDVQGAPQFKFVGRGFSRYVPIQPVLQNSIEHSTLWPLLDITSFRSIK